MQLHFGSQKNQLHLGTEVGVCIYIVFLIKCGISLSICMELYCL
jgi:hypothetical protein